MRVATDQREMAEDRQPAPQPPPRLGGTDLFRGAMVILAAVIIGGLVLSRGIDGDDTAPGAGLDTEQADVDPASGAADAETDLTGADASADGATDPGTDPATSGAATDPATDPGTTPTVPDDSATGDTTATGEDTGATTETTTSPLDTVRPPAEVRTLVLNAGGPQGIAGRATELLQAASYLTSAAKNADVNGSSAIYYAEGFQAEALAVASVFGPGVDAVVQPLDPAAPPSTDLQQATVIVVIGPDDVIAVP